MSKGFGFDPKEGVCPDGAVGSYVSLATVWLKIESSSSEAHPADGAVRSAPPEELKNM
jgi:hypothetical protein